MKRREPEAEPARPREQSSEDRDPETIDHDDSLILWMLGLSPTKRLAFVQGFVDSVRILRSGRRSGAAEASDKESVPATEGTDSMIGLFADEPDLVDEVCRMAMEDRETRHLRA